MLSALRRLAGRMPAEPQAFPADAPPETLYRFSLRGIELELPRAILTEQLWLGFIHGYYESSEIAALAATIRAGDVVLELGAGVGFISSLMLKQLGARSVTAVEANPTLIPIIRRTHALNGVQAEVVQGVVAATDGEAGFYLQPAFFASSAMKLPNSEVVRLPAVGLLLARPERVRTPREEGHVCILQPGEQHETRGE